MKKYPVTEMHWVVTRLLIDLMKLGMEEDCSQNKGYRRTTDNMAIEKKKKVWVVGHKNPDTDSICAAIAYANLKNQSDEGRYEAKRAGELNEETKYVLKTFGVKSPGLITDVCAQVKDIEIRKTPGVSGKISLKRAWEMMKEQNVVTLPVTDGENNLEGLIITGDIATSYMDVYDNSILSRAKTQYQNIVDTLEGQLLCGNEHAYFTKGKVVVGSANPETMEQFLDDDDLVIMGNRYDAQVCALECNASCLIIAGSPQVPKSIIKMAAERNCVVITTDYDTYTAARLVNQSMPIKFFMRRDQLVTFELEEYIDDVRGIMSKETDDEYALENENEYGKNEMWYVLDAEPGAYLYCGLSRASSKEEIEERIKNNTITEILNKIEVKKGDVVMVKAGTIHAIGAGIFICEIQQNSNCTYRMYDYDRRDKFGNPRELHVAKSLDVVNPVKYEKDNKCNVMLAHNEHYMSKRLVQCKYFEVIKYEIEDEAKIPVDEASFLSVIVIDGEGTIMTDDNDKELKFKAGESFFINAGKRNVVVKGRSTCIITHV